MRTIRELDGVFFREKNENGEWDNICFSDMTEEQQDKVMEGRSEEWLKNMCKILAEKLRQIGDQFGLIATIPDYGQDDDEEYDEDEEVSI